ncbi:group II intron maturase-specific domain-containing protein [Chloroflexota bacterium]
MPEIVRIRETEGFCEEIDIRLIRFLNMVIRGWRNYFRIGNSTKKYQDLDHYVGERLRRWVRSQKGTRGHWNERAFNTLMARCGLEYFFSTGRCATRP